MQPGVSIAAVALANQLNANFVRGWVKAYRDQQGHDVPQYVGTDNSSKPEKEPPATLVPATVEVTEAVPSADIQIEIRRQQTVFQIAWPISQAAACAQWLREVLR
jgi:transposase-like protein